MRVFVLALMIALLPVRGWIGDAMAMELMTPAAPQHAAPAAATMAMAHCHEAQAAEQDAGAADMAPSTGDAHEHVAGDCGSCSLCQICHSVALTALSLPLPAGALPGAAPASRQPLYASVERALGDKPPIL